VGETPNEKGSVQYRKKREIKCRSKEGKESIVSGIYYPQEGKEAQNVKKACGEISSLEGKFSIFSIY